MYEYQKTNKCYLNKKHKTREAIRTLVLFAIAVILVVLNHLYRGAW